MDRHQFLVETSWLAAHLHDAHLRIVDMRGYVRTIEHDGVQEALYVGAQDEYEQGHIPGAVYIDWSSDIVDHDAAVEAQIATPDRFGEVMGKLGIGDQHLVVTYDSHPASQFATRLWWALNYYVHDQVVVLNGGIEKWLREQRPLETTLPTYPGATFTAVPQAQLRATAEDIMAYLDKQGVTLIDARERGQYSGEIVRGHGRPGHIPGALSIPREELIDSATGSLPPQDRPAGSA
jgi:thiosulfate/3-mercaptopyruvate sulfurtransferase